MSWHYLQNQIQQGPFDEAQFKELVDSGDIPTDTFVWTEGMPEWRPFGDIQFSPSVSDVPDDQAICKKCRGAFLKKQMFPIGPDWTCEFCTPVHLSDQTIAALMKAPWRCRLIGFKKLTIGVLGTSLLLLAYLFLLPLLLPKGGHILIPVIIFIPVIFVIVGFVETTTGKPFEFFAASWDSLPQWVRLPLSFICFVVALIATIYVGLLCTGQLR